jgi:hypothetical protein
MAVELHSKLDIFDRSRGRVPYLKYDLPDPAMEVISIELFLSPMFNHTFSVQPKKRTGGYFPAGIEAIPNQPVSS